MLDVNRVEVVDVLDVLFSPPDRNLRISVYLVLPSVLHGLLPLIVSVLSSSRLQCCTTA